MTTSEKNAGTALIFGSLLLVATMILHPAQADGEFKSINIISHSLAIVAIPFCLYGFQGLSAGFKSSEFLSNTAFAMMAVGLLAGMFAAAINGLALTFFIAAHQETAQTASSIHLILDYSMALNHAMDYIFIGASVGAILFWSITMIRTEKFPKWLGYYGILLVTTGIVLFFIDVQMLSVAGFRMVIFGMVSWILITAYLLIWSKAN
ncbi:MAG: hypothetical protein AAF934_12435 [Bacteroidota bacterium]